VNYEKEREAHAQPVEMTIRSRVPSKWRFVDLETGDVWRWDENLSFQCANDMAPKDWEVTCCGVISIVRAISRDAAKIRIAKAAREAGYKDVFKNLRCRRWRQK